MKPKVKYILLGILLAILILQIYRYSTFTNFKPILSDKELELDKINLPLGFTIEIYAIVPGARSMALGDQGTLFVGTRKPGKVYAIKDNQITTLVEGWKLPNGVAFREGDLYVAEVSRIWKFENIESNLDNPKPVLINDDFPKDLHHGWKFIRFGPDDKLYIPIGAPCNICKEEEYAVITRMNPDGSNKEIFSQGVRMSVGFDWHPETKELWFTDNGRDLLGENLPPDELNHAPRKDMHFGFPYCHGDNVEDPKFKDDCENYTPPRVNLGPHVAALGMRFYTGNMFPKEYKNKIFIAEHGSWNRKVPIGYRITLVDTETNTYEVFADGWLQGETAFGRPVDVLVMPDGSLLVSDDKAGVIYRISYKNI